MPQYGAFHSPSRIAVAARTHSPESLRASTSPGCSVTIPVVRPRGSFASRKSNSIECSNSTEYKNRCICTDQRFLYHGAQYDPGCCSCRSFHAARPRNRSSRLAVVIIVGRVVVLAADKINDDVVVVGLCLTLAPRDWHDGVAMIDHAGRASHGASLGLVAWLPRPATRPMVRSRALFFAPWPAACTTLPSFCKVRK